MSKIVITGYGVAVPGSNNAQQFERQLKEGRHGLKIVSNERFPQSKSLALGYLDSIVFEREEKEYKKYPKIAKAQINTTEEALEMSGVDLRLKKAGVFVGTSLGGIEGYEANVPISHRGDYKAFPNSTIGQTNTHSTASAICGHLELNGIAKTLSSGCTASMEALESAILYIKAGVIDTAIIGGVDIANTPGLLYAFSKIRSLPLGRGMDEAGLPFSKNSKGFVVAEGSASIVIEREKDAIARGAVILAEIDDVRSNNDGFGVYGSDHTGNNMLNLSRETVANRMPDYVNSQALGLRPSDEVESNNHQKLFSNQIPITSIKGMIGHAFGASGLIQIISSLIGMKENFIPYTTRTDKFGHEGLNIVDQLEERKVSEVLITCHGYGGNNTVAYLKRHSKG